MRNLAGVVPNCDPNAVYANIAGSLTCQCKADFTGDGQIVSTGGTRRTNINECMVIKLSTYHVNPDCTDLVPDLN